MSGGPQPRREPSTNREPHRHREAAQAFGVDAARYDRTRPPYPDALVRRVVGSSPGPRVLDVGSGTGIAARQFQALGCTVLAVEPDPRMAQFARDTGVTVEVSTFEDWDPAGREFDAVVAGTSWHWIDPVLGAGKAADALAPGGLLAPFHHVLQMPPTVAETFADIYQRLVPGSPFDARALTSALDAWRPVAERMSDGIRTTGRFTEPQEWRYDWQRTYERDEWLDQLPTSGGLTRVAPAVLRAVLDAVGDSIDALGGTVPVSYSTLAITAVRMPAS